METSREKIRVKGYLERMEADDVQTLGKLTIKDNGKTLFFCLTLELADRNNQQGISRIPNGRYRVVKRVSPKYGEHFILDGVQNRSYILIHNGNYYSQTRGCILVGNDFKDINGDGHKDVLNSKETLRKLYATVDAMDLIVRGNPEPKK